MSSRDSEILLNSFGYDRCPAEYPPPGMHIPMKNPYDTCDDFDPTGHNFPPLERSPTLAKIHLESSSVTFLERLPNGYNENAPSGVFVVNIENMGGRVLKIFHGVEKERRGRSFTREARAYQNLLHSGVCAAGVVPYCYGWALIDLTQWPPSGKRDWLLHFRGDAKPPRALVLEFLPNASRMTLRCITPKKAEEALNGLKTIHQAYVQHGDIHPRNLLSLPEGRVVWIDFECATSWPWHKQANRHRAQEELGLHWCWLYQIMLPWKWRALKNLNEPTREDQLQLEHLEQTLISKGATIYASPEVP